MKVIITGGAGFIGSHLAEALLDRSDSVCVIDNFDGFYNEKIKKNNISTALKNLKYVLYVEDVRNTSRMEEILRLEKPDVIVHLAAKAGVRLSLEKPMDYIDANIKGTVSLLNAMNCASVKKMVFASSSSVYGNSREIPFNESNPCHSPISVYATTKQSGEMFTRTYNNLYGIDVINLRFFTVYGPRQRPDLAIHKFIRANLNGDEIQVYGDGSMARDYTYVSDTVNGIIAAIDRVVAEDGIYETYNLGNSSPVKLLDLIATIDESTGQKSKIEHKPVPDGDVHITYADISLAQSKLNYSPSVSLKDGLVKFLEWFKIQYV